MVALLLLLLGFVPLYGMDNQAPALNAQARQVPSLFKLSVANLEQLLGNASTKKRKELLAKLDAFPEAVKQYIIDYYSTKYKLQIPACQFQLSQCVPFNPLPAGTYITCVSPMPDNETLIFGAKNGNVYLFDPLTKKIKTVLKGHTRAITSLCVSCQGRWLLTGSSDKTARCWDLSTGECDGIMDHKYTVEGVAFYYDDAMNITFILTFDSQARIYKWTLDKYVRSRAPSPANIRKIRFIKPVRQVAFDNRGHAIVVGCCYTIPSTKNKTEHFPMIDVTTGVVYQVPYVDERADLISGGVNFLLRARARELVSQVQHIVKKANLMHTAVAFNATGTCSVLANGTSVTWVKDEKQYGTIPSPDSFAQATCVAVDSRGAYCAVGTVAHTIVLYDLKNKKYRALLAGHQAPLTAVIFSPDNNYLLSTDTTGLVRVWDMLSSGQNITLAQLWSLLKSHKSKQAGCVIV